MDDRDFVRLVDDFGSLVNGIHALAHRVIRLVACADHGDVENVPVADVAVVGSIAYARFCDTVDHARGLADRIRHDMPDNPDATDAASKLEETIRALADSIDVEVLKRARARAEELVGDGKEHDEETSL